MASFQGWFGKKWMCILNRQIDVEIEVEMDIVYWTLKMCRDLPNFRGATDVSTSAIFSRSKVKTPVLKTDYYFIS